MTPSVLTRPQASAATLADHAVVVLSRSSWDEPPRIRHQVARQMARFTRVIFVETPEDWRQKSDSLLETVAPNIFRCRLGNPHRFPRRLHLYLDPLRTRLNAHHLRDLFDLASETLGSQPVLINFNYDFGSLMRSPAFGTTVYYCNDDFMTWAPGPVAARLMERRESITAADADFCLTVSVPLTEKLRRWNDRTTTLLPGHEFTERWPPVRRDGPIRLAFMGYLNDRIDYAWLQKAAEQEDMEVHLIGPVVEETAAIGRLIASAHVVYHGPRVGSEMQDLLLDADVLVLPYQVTRSSGMLVATAPNKLYTYLAAAKPIVTSDLPALLSLDPGVLYRASDGEGFVAAIRQAFKEDNATLRERRLALARENTWDQRGDQLKTMIEVALQRRTADAGPRGS